MCRSNVVDLIPGTNAGRSRQRPSSAPLVFALAGLTVKYETLLALRVQREHLESNGVFALVGEAAQTRKRVARGLAQQFPGALRELDCWPAPALAARLQDLADERARAYALPQTTHPERPWVLAVLAYHAVMRQAQATRNAARARLLATAPLTERGQRFLKWHADSRQSLGAENVPENAVALARFALGGGRSLVELVCENVAAALGCQPGAVRAWVFGGSA